LERPLLFKRDERRVAVSNEEIGSAYRDLVATQNALETLEEEGKTLIDDLHLLAKCLDSGEEHTVLSSVENEQLHIWDAGHKTISLPLRVEAVAVEICSLKNKKDALEKRLDLLLSDV